jgi:hypothetical protein
MSAVLLDAASIATLTYLVAQGDKAGGVGAAAVADGSKKV